MGRNRVVIAEMQKERVNSRVKYNIYQRYLKLQESLLLGKRRVRVHVNQKIMPQRSRCNTETETDDCKENK